MADERFVTVEVGGDFATTDELDALVHAIDATGWDNGWDGDEDGDPGQAIVKDLVSHWLGKQPFHASFHNVSHGTTEELDGALAGKPWRKTVGCGDDDGWITQCNLPTTNGMKEAVQSIACNDNGLPILTLEDLRSMTVVAIAEWLIDVSRPVPPITFSGEAAAHLSRIVGESVLLSTSQSEG